MRIEILGSGCVNCQKLEENVKEALKKLNLDAEVEKVTDMAKIMSYGVMSMPGLVMDGVVKMTGRVPGVKEIENILKG